MSFVHGDSESARSLSSLFKMTMDKIEQDTEELEKCKQGAMTGWNDFGVEELEEIVNTLKKALSSATESRRNIESALEAYAEFLEDQK